jgi:hypothetical protein
MLESFTVETFAPLLDTTFTVSATDASGATHAVPLTLVAATPATAPPGDRGRPPFSLLFRGPANLRLHQATHPLTHDTLGAFDLFLVPVGLAPDGAEYEAVFS